MSKKMGRVPVLLFSTRASIVRTSQKKPAEKTGSVDARNRIYLMFKSLHSIAQGSFLGCVNFYDSACYRVAKREGPLRL